MRKKNQINLPTSPNPDTLHILLRARLMLSHALEHAGVSSEYDNMIAVLSLDSTVEYVLRSIPTQLDLESIAGRSFDIFDLSSLASEINKVLNEFAGVKLPYLGQLRLLRQIRNLVQHGAVAPAADLERFAKITERFFDRVLAVVFGLNIKTLKISSVIKNETVRNYLREAELHIERKEWLKSVVAARNAFENEYFNKVKSHNVSIGFYPALVLERERSDIANYTWDLIKDELQFSYLGINTFEYRRFKEYLNHIPHEFCAEDTYGNVLMQRPWNEQDAIFCYHYAANTILRWQTQEAEKLYMPEPDKEYVFKETIGNISLSKDAEPGCHYIYENNERIYLIYTSNELRKRLEKLSKDRKYIYKRSRYADGEKEIESKRKIQIHGIFTFLMVNEPELWAVVIRYKELSHQIAY